MTNRLLPICVLAAMISLPHECDGFTPVMQPRTLLVSSPTVSYSMPNFSRNAYKPPSTTIRRMAAASDDSAFLSDDPFVILGLDAPTADKKVLKRAYKKRALKYHPDVVTDIHSSAEDKKNASDRFAKINGAYEQLMGKGKGTNSSTNSSNDSSSSSSGGWTPPHRRTSSYSSSSSSRSTSSSGSGAPSTDWRDYMPDYQKENEADYDTGGDSFGQIFSDMFTGAASAAVTGGVGGVGGGIFSEFIEFLEGGSGGFAGSAEDDADLRVLLKTGSLEEIAEEMDDTQMVVQQLETKSRGLDDEVFGVDAEAKMASRFSEKIHLEEKAAELKARKEIVNGYLDRARKRLLSLQTRYKDLIAYGGANDEYAASGGRRGSRSSSWDDDRGQASTKERNSASSSSSYDSSRGSSSYGSSSSSYSSSTGAAATGSVGTASDNNTKNEDDGDGWMNEGFGSSSGRSRGSRRGSGRRRASSSRRTTASAPRQEATPASPTPAPSPSTSSYSSSSSSSSSYSSGRSSNSRPSPRATPSPSSSSSSSSMSKSNYSNDIPPHRRTSGSSFASRQEEDRKRMQELKVDEEFEKLKKELGL